MAEARLPGHVVESMRELAAGFAAWQRSPSGAAADLEFAKLSGRALGLIGWLLQYMDRDCRPAELDEVTEAVAP